MCDHTVGFLSPDGDSYYPIAASDAKDWAISERERYFKWVHSDPKTTSLNRNQLKRCQDWTLKDWLASEGDLFDFCPRCGERIDWGSLLNE